VRLTLAQRLATSGDVLIANAQVVDRRGRPVPTASNLLKFAVQGGQVIGVGNGNPNSIEADVASERHAFNGLAQAIVRVGAAGLVDVSVASEGLGGSSLRAVAAASGDRR
jgi:beta-galactosidase